MSNLEEAKKEISKILKKVISYDEVYFLDGKYVRWGRVESDLYDVLEHYLTKCALDTACVCGSRVFYTDKVLGVVCCNCQASRQDVLRDGEEMDREDLINDAVSWIVAAKKSHPTLHTPAWVAHLGVDIASGEDKTVKIRLCKCGKPAHFGNSQCFECFAGGRGE